MRELFANGAVSRLAAPVSTTDVVIQLVDGSGFPQPAADEYFALTLVGNVNQVVEVVKVVDRSDNILTVERAYDGSTSQAFAPNDQAYHAFTAGAAVTFQEAMKFYLDPATTDPTVDRFGDPLQKGMLYYNLSNLQMREYNGTVWRNFAAIVSVAGVSEYLWDGLADQAPNYVMLWPDDNLRDAPEYSAEDFLYTVYVNGKKLQDAGTAGIVNGFIAADDGFGLLQITLTEGLTGVAGGLASNTVTVQVGLSDDPTSFLRRTEQDASSWGVYSDDSGTVNKREEKLITERAAKDYTDTLEAKVDGIVSGYKNLLINPQERVNQRYPAGFPGWGGLANGEYGPDRWRKHANGKEQVVEAANIPNGVYTLSWDGDGSGTLGGTTATSPITETVGGADTSVIVPEDATNVQLEAGSVESAFEVRPISLEVDLCRYYFMGLGSGVGHHIVGHGVIYSQGTSDVLVQGSRKMRAVPTLNASSSELVMATDIGTDTTDDDSIENTENGIVLNLFPIPGSVPGTSQVRFTQITLLGDAADVFGLDAEIY